MSDRAGIELAAYILRNAASLRLDADEIAALNAQFWRWQSDGVPDDVVGAVERLIGQAKARAAMLAFERTDNTSFADIIRAHVDRHVDESIDRKIKSASVAERDLSEAVLNKLIGWAKVYATLIAVPLSLLLLIFALFGYTTLQDVRGAKDKVDAIIAQSKGQIAASQRQMAQSNRQLTTNRSKIGEAESQIADAQRQLDAVKRQLQGRGAEFANLNSNAALKVRLAQLQLERLGGQLRALSQASEANSQRLTRAIGDIQTIKAKIGGFSASVESSSHDPGLIQHDPSGAVYGPWGIPGAAVQQFLRAQPYAQRFAGLQPGSAAFDAQWKTIASADPDTFYDDQRSYFYNLYFTPLAALIKEKSGLDVTTRSTALQEVVMQMGVNSGARSRFVTQAIAKLTATGQWDVAARDFDRTFIAACYDERIAFFQSRFPRFVRSAEVLKAKALKMYDSEKAGH